MRVFNWLVITACAALILAGGGWTIVHDSGDSTHPRMSRGRGTSASATSGTAPSSGAPPGSAVPATTAPADTSPVPTAFALQADLLIPNDLGGYYTPVPADSAPQWADSGCLRPLGQPGVAARQAATFLRGPYEGSLPLINERIDAYASVAAAVAAYRSMATALGACKTPTVSVYTESVTVPLTPLPIAGLGDQSIAVQGAYHLNGRHQELTVAVVRTGPQLTALAYADAVPASNTILGSAQSTIRAAVGKAAP